MLPLLDDLTRTLIQALWLDYIEARIPYGNDEMGLWRWVRERAGIDVPPMHRQEQV